MNKDNDTAAPPVQPIPGRPVPQPGVGGDQDGCSARDRPAEDKRAQEQGGAGKVGMTGRARLQPAEEQTVPGRRGKMPQAGRSSQAKVPTSFAGPTTILEAHAIDAGVADRADMPPEETGHVGV